MRGGAVRKKPVLSGDAPNMTGGVFLNYVPMVTLRRTDAKKCSNSRLEILRGGAAHSVLREQSGGVWLQQRSAAGPDNGRFSL